MGHLNLRTKLSYGIGEMASEIPGSIMVFFLLFFFTNVAGLNPGLAGMILLVGRVWDGVNDPMVGWLSDHTQFLLGQRIYGRWGRRYPWMLAGAIPLGVLFFCQWLVPPWPQQTQRFAYYVVLALLFYAAYTLVIIPYNTLAAELTQGYDERTALVSFKATFSIGSSILGLVLAQLIFALIPDPSLKYPVLGIAGGGLSIGAIFLCVWGTRPRYQWIQTQRQSTQAAEPLPFIQQIRIAFNTRPFLYVVGIYLCSWLGIQVTAAILPYFVVNWMGLPEVHFTQIALTVQVTALICMFFWSRLGQRIGKRAIYCLGIPLTLMAQAGFWLIQPGQVLALYGLAVLIGAGLAVAYLVPWSMLPDVIDLDELNTGQRREGLFAGFMVQMQKGAIALSVVLIGNTLDWAGFIPTVAGQAPVTQPPSALLTIRLLMAGPSIILMGGILMAYLYPITREIHGQILLQLQEKRQTGE